MKIKAAYANAPQWKEVLVKSRLPEQLKCLDELAHNMWWAWNYEARDLWRSLDEELYEEVGHNPVLLLERLSYERKHELEKDKEIMKNVKDVYAKFRKYMDVKPDSKTFRRLFQHGIRYQSGAQDLLWRTWNARR